MGTLPIYPIFPLIFASCFVSSLCKYQKLKTCQLSHETQTIILVCVKGTCESTNCTVENDLYIRNQTFCHLLPGQFDMRIGDKSEYRRMSFKNCTLNAIPDRIFNDYNQLEVFDIGNLGIASIPTNTTKLKNLKALIVSNDNITEIRSKSFEKENELEFLDVSENEISVLEVNLFEKLSKLRHFNASNNKINEIPQDFLEKTQKLQELDLSKNSIEKFPPVIYGNLGDPELSNLTTLNLSSKLSSNLSSLNLSSNNIKELNPNFFKNTPNLAYLSVSHNKLTKIPSNLLKNAKKIIEINFSHNEIREIPSKGFPLGNRVKKVNFCSTKIAKLSADSFDDLSSLVTLNLSHNEITEIPSVLVEKAENLVKFDVSFNKLKNVDDLAFRKNSSLEVWIASHNQLSGFNGNHLEYLGNLVLLDVSFNHIPVLLPNIFQKLHNLVFLDVSFNPIKQIGGETFLSLTKLTHLNLSYAEISEVPPGAFTRQKLLQTIDLSNNSIISFDSNALPPLPNHLELIDLRNNLLQHLKGFANYSKNFNGRKNATGVLIEGFDCNYHDELMEDIFWITNRQQWYCISPIPTNNHKKLMFIIVGSVGIITIGLVIVAAVYYWIFKRRRALMEQTDIESTSYLRSLLNDVDYQPIADDDDIMTHKREY